LATVRDRIPVRERLAASLRAEIAARRLPSGTRLPSVRALARERGVSVFTAAAVYELLVAAGVAEARRGSGYFVAGGRPPRRRVREFPADSLWERRREAEASTIRVDAGCGWLPDEWLDQAACRAALRAVARAGGIRAGYASPAGSAPLRQQFATSLRGRGLELQEEQILTTAGASQALELIVRECLAPGDLVVVEDPAYPPLLDLLRARRVKLQTVHRGTEGPDADQLAKLLKTRRPAAFFTNTVLHNPTGTTTSLPVAHRIVELADRHDFLIVEDDIFAELAPRPEPSLAALDDLRRVVFVSSVSKTISADLRVGYIGAAPALARRLARAKTLSSLASSELMENVVLHILTHGRYRRHLETLRRRLAQAQRRVQDLLEARGVVLAHRPASGMFLWARLPATETVPTLWRLAAAAGVLLAPGELFRADGRASAHWRFNVAYADAPELLGFLDTLTAGRRADAS
jgi:DNA-binding transcriptional MocR family regulator